MRTVQIDQDQAAPQMVRWVLMGEGMMVHLLVVVEMGVTLQEQLLEMLPLSPCGCCEYYAYWL